MGLGGNERAAGGDDPSARGGDRARHPQQRVLASSGAVVQQARLMEAAGTAWHAVKCGNLEVRRVTRGARAPRGRRVAAARPRWARAPRRCAPHRKAATTPSTGPGTPGC
jgi:hypothetical protein